MNLLRITPERLVEATQSLTGQSPSPAAINAETILAAATAGEDQLRTLIRGPHAAASTATLRDRAANFLSGPPPTLDRSERLRRAQDVLRMLPSLNLDPQRHSLVTRVTRSVLQELLDDVTTEQRVTALRQESVVLTQTIETVLAEERRTATAVERAGIEAREAANTVRGWIAGNKPPSSEAWSLPCRRWCACRGGYGDG